ncbi:nitrogen regulatory protein P-II 2 [Xenorhabdus japonica]|uniref:Nitrogen regulatory protein P-II 2 n=1 Tax=Xenorhabdus japonica TaxID=53341 RepID=A0A1I5CY39_9GAMM|nr:nitrogen regulatory protein P-II 2 [Xenorhabdus japonica]
MKLITIIIKPFKLEEVREALADIGIQATVLNIKIMAQRDGKIHSILRSF